MPRRKRMPQNFDDAPDVVIDDFDTAGVTPKGPAHVQCVSWEYQPPAAGTTNSPQIRGEFNILDRPSGASGGKVWDGFFMDPNSMWRLRNAALGAGLNYDGATSAKQIAKDLVGRDFYVNIDHRTSKKTGQTFPFFSKFGANYEEITGEGAEGSVPF
jgi:hypothetical protein